MLWQNPFACVGKEECPRIDIGVPAITIADKGDDISSHSMM